MKLNNLRNLLIGIALLSFTGLFGQRANPINRNNWDVRKMEISLELTDIGRITPPISPILHVKSKIYFTVKNNTVSNLILDLKSNNHIDSITSNLSSISWNRNQDVINISTLQN